MGKSSFYYYPLLLIIFWISFSCSLPRIIIVKDPLTPEEHINLGVTYEKKGEFDAALHEYKKAAKKLPIAYFYMGNIYFRKKDLDKAERSYKKSIKKNPKHAESYNNLAWLYYSSQINLEEAEELANKARILDPSKSHLYDDTLRKIIDLKKSMEGQEKD